MNFVSYYIIGLPIAIVLALVADLGALGIWSGLFIADILQVQYTVHNIILVSSHG